MTRRRIFILSKLCPSRAENVKSPKIAQNSRLRRKKVSHQMSEEVFDGLGIFAHPSLLILIASKKDQREFYIFLIYQSIPLFEEFCLVIFFNR